MIDPRHASSPSPFTLKDLMDRYRDLRHRPSTRRRGAIVFRNLIRHFGTIPVEDLTREAILQYISNTQRSTSTAALELRILRAALNNAADFGLVPATIAQSLLPRIRVIRSPRGYRPLNPQEVLQLLQSSPGWIHAPILFALHTGLRFHELASLTWEHVDWGRAQLILSGHSFRRQRRVPLAKTARTILDRLRSLSPCSGILFKTPHGRCLGQATSALVRLSARKAGLHDIRLHDLRTTFIAWCVYADVPHITLAEIAGYTPNIRLSVVSWLAKPRPEDVFKRLREPNNFVELAKLLKQNPSGLNPIILP